MLTQLLGRQSGFYLSLWSDSLCTNINFISRRATQTRREAQKTVVQHCWLPRGTNKLIANYSLKGTLRTWKEYQQSQGAAVELWRQLMLLGFFTPVLCFKRTDTHPSPFSASLVYASVNKLRIPTRCLQKYRSRRFGVKRQTRTRDVAQLGDCLHRMQETRVWALALHKLGMEETACDLPLQPRGWDKRIRSRLF